jgi:hypothetical protein
MKHLAARIGEAKATKAMARKKARRQVDACLQVFDSRRLSPNIGWRKTRRTAPLTQNVRRAYG